MSIVKSFLPHRFIIASTSKIYDTRRFHSITVQRCLSSGIHFNRYQVWEETKYVLCVITLIT